MLTDALVLTPVAMLSVRLFGLDRAARVVGGLFTRRADSSLSPVRTAALVNFAVARLAGRCLTKALVLQAVLSRRGVESSLLVGAATIEGCFRAHAWVEARGQVLIGVGSHRYTPLISLSSLSARG